eukprot:CAMPEP_0198116592 /NCGR_PEP_ID=MMETSP1442-20131203/13410_1 /TAXON_ID= /ORGANISM="Craspedostauros australis, Strain CCMP3328" /LENGTH=261 /DNA_ID=CAMNT_0043774455 /DNA_START=46 /DNA_END=831 /DNA_ORIENTATION=+
MTNAAIGESKLDDVPLTSYVHAGRVQARDLDMQVTQQDERMIDEMEDAWMKFLLANPRILHRTGKSKARIDKLLSAIDVVKEQQDKVQVEMKHQRDFIESRTADLERAYQEKMEQHDQEHRVAFNALRQQQELSARADQQMMEVLPWQCFFAALDEQAEKAGDAKRTRRLDAPTGPTPPKQRSNARSIRPSKRAMYIVNDSVGCEKDVDLRAFSIDNALIRAKIRMNQKLKQGLKDHAASLENVGEFLKENGAQKIVSSRS